MTTRLPMPLAQRVVEHRGVLESGLIADMRRYALRSETIHTRLVGEDRTLCGRSLRGFEGRWSWQFVHRGSFGASLPSGSAPEDRNACRSCARSPVIVATAEVVAARRKAWLRISPRRRAVA